MSFFVFEGERKMRNVIEVYVENLKKYNKINYVIVKNIKSLFSIKFYLL